MAKLRTMQLVIWLGALVLSAAAAAQSLPVIPIFTTDAPDQAHRSAIERKRLLLVAAHGDNSRAWSSPTVAEWVTWHAVAVRFNPRTQGETNPLLRTALGGHLPRSGYVQVLKNGRWTRELEAGTMLQFLFQIDVLMDTFRARDPVWMEAHEHANPEPPPPPKPQPLYKSASDAATLVTDHAEGGQERPADVFHRLKIARSRAATGPFQDATGYFTWLWERAPELEPGFRAARLTWLAADMKALADKAPAARDHFRILRDRMWDRAMWWTYDDIQEWATLNMIVGDVAQTIEYFDLYLNDPAEGSIVPRSERSALQQLTELPEWTNPGALDAGALNRLGRLVSMAKSAIPRGAGEGIRKQVAALRRRLVVDEGCRLYAAFLKAGRDTDAARASSIVLEFIDDAPTRIALVSTAVAADQPRPVQHLRWLDEACAQGQDHPRLREILNHPEPAPAVPR